MNRVGHEHENSRGPMSIALCYLMLLAKIVYVNPGEARPAPSSNNSSLAYASWPTTVYWPLARERRAALYGSAALTITWSYSLDVLYLSYMAWYLSSTESSGAIALAERARAPLV